MTTQLILLSIGTFLIGTLLLMIAFPVLVNRILDEEKVLEKALSGYKEYEHKVHYRLLPYLW